MLRNLMRKLGIFLFAVGVVSGYITLGRAANNYLATVPGSGTNFAAILISSILHPVVLICDATLGEAQCAAVNSSGQIAVQMPPSLPLPTGAATSALQTTGNTSLTTINSTLGSPFQAGASIGNTAFGVSAQATGGASPTGNIGAANTTAVVVKSSAGTLIGAQLYNIGTVPAYLKIYNATTATCGSGTPVKRLMIPVASTNTNGAGSNVTFGPAGIALGTGITYCLTLGITDADTTAPTASTVIVNLDWK